MHALVTGASGGLGQAYCDHLASTGHDLVLTSRRTDELEAIATRLRATYGVDVVVLPADLSDEAARDDLFAELGRRGIEVDVLVNNAGFGTVADVADIEVARLNDEVALNCGAVAHLSRLFLPAMLRRNEGTIVNVASTAAFQPLPTMAVYGATKAFVLSFTQALWAETRSTGVRVTAICPGPTETAFFAVAGNDRMMRNRRTPEQVVAATFSALERRRPSVVDGRYNAVQAQAAKVLPASVVAPLVRLWLKGFRSR